MLSGTLEYLMSSLPHLQFTNAFEIRNRVQSIFKAYATEQANGSLTNTLNEEAAKFLTPEKEELFSKINLDTIHKAEFQNSPYAVLSDFSNFNFELKKQLKALRDSRQESDETNRKKTNALNLEDANPLEQEIQIMNLQWQEVEQLSVGHFSDFDALIAYKIKLMLIERWWSFDESKGYDKYLDLIHMRDDG